MDDKTIESVGKLVAYNTVNYEIQTTAKTVIMVAGAVLATAAVVNMFTGNKTNNTNAAFNVAGGIR